MSPVKAILIVYGIVAVVFILTAIAMKELNDKNLYKNS